MPCKAVRQKKNLSYHLPFTAGLRFFNISRAATMPPYDAFCRSISRMPLNDAHFCLPLGAIAAYRFFE